MSEFYIQAGNPRFCRAMDEKDETLSDAMESIFLLNTESAVMAWNHISIPLSYKYDISYMLDDLLNLLNGMQQAASGEMTIHWLPDTFRCDWQVTWNQGKMDIQSNWECTVGHLERLLNDNSRISIPVKHFESEWKEVLRNAVIGLRRCGYNENRIKGMRLLAEQTDRIEISGILYRN